MPAIPEPKFLVVLGTQFANDTYLRRPPQGQTLEDTSPAMASSPLDCEMQWDL